MRPALRLLAGFGSLVILIVLLAGGLLVLAIGTQSGRDLIQAQTEELAGQLLGPGLRATLSDQSLTLSGGTLALAFQNVAIVDAADARSVAQAKTVAVGLRLLPLLSGDLKFEKLKVTGLSVDPVVLGWLAKRDDPMPMLPAAIDEAVANVDRQFVTLSALDIDSVEIDDARLAGQPDLTLAGATLVRHDDDGGMSLNARVVAPSATTVISGSADLDQTSHRLSAVTLEAFRRASAAGTPSGADRPWVLDAPFRMGLALRSDPETSKRTVTLRSELGSGRFVLGPDTTIIDTVALTLRHSEGDPTITVEPSRFAFKDLQGSLSGTLTQTSGNGYALALTSPDLTSAVGQPAGQTRTAVLSIEGSTDSSLQELRLDRVAMELPKGSLLGRAVVSLATPQSLTSINFAATDLDTMSLKAFWPHMLSSETRGWTIRNLRDGGIIPSASLRFQVTRERFAAILDEAADPTSDELQLDLGFRDGAFGAFGALPDFVRASGALHTSGPQTTLTLDKAGIAGFDKIAVEPSTLSLTAMPGAGPEISGEVSLNLSGDVDQLLGAASAQPIGLRERLNFAPGDATGQVKAAVGATFLLGDQVAKGDEVKAWSVIADLDGLTLRKPVEGRRLNDLTGTISAAPGMAVGDLTGKVDDLPATIAFAEPLQPHPTGARSLTVGVELSATQMRSLLPLLEDVVAGPVKAELTRNETGFGAKVDLTAAKLSLPWVGWTKGSGIAASLALDLVPSGDGFLLKDMRLDGNGFAAVGSAELDGSGLKTASIGKLTLNPGDDVALTLERVSNGYIINVKGGRYDARPFLSDLRRDIAGTTAEGSGSKRQVDVTVALDSVVGFSRQELRNFSLNYAGGAEGVAALSGSATTSGGAAVTADISPRGNGRSVTVTAADAGALLGFAGLYERMKGGNAALQLTGAPHGAYAGTLVLHDFTLIDEPRLSNLVGSSPSGGQTLSARVGRDLQAERAFFDTAEARLRYEAKSLRIDEGILRGPVFGSSFEGVLWDARNRIDIAGSFMPAYGINRIFGAIPLVGEILGNGNEGGLIGITYRLTGEFASPALSINPISAIAPGIFRRIFSY
ncbi:hypothetical protein [Mangrovicella endophytica]|uniref:hypothetical protein n=1 Tax=Mangrovicella endophytica TaxID=2066697 RepID=UPI000C9E34CA|nr:hypothetical protein [Mangrovicella endophytica]